MSTVLATQTHTSLANFATTAEDREKIVCKDMLRGNQSQVAQADAAKAYQAMLENPLVVATYGSEVLVGLNNLVKRMFKDIKAGKDQEVSKMIKELGANLDKTTRRYDAANPKFAAKYQDMSDGLFGIFGGAAAFWRKFMRDVQSIQSQVESAEQVIAHALISTEEIISYYTELYRENDIELDKVIYQIAVLEYIVEIASKDAPSDPTATDYDSSEERGQRADLIKNLQNRIGAFKSRLFMGWTKSPQLRSQISTNTSLHISFVSTRDITFTMMLEVMINIALLRRSQDMAEQMEEFRQMANVAIQQFAVNASIQIPMIEKAASVPILMAKTLEVMRDCYIVQTEGVIKVLEEAAEEAAVIEDLSVSTSQVFTDQNNKVSQSVIDRAVQTSLKLDEISTKTLDSATQQ